MGLASFNRMRRLKAEQEKAVEKVVEEVITESPSDTTESGSDTVDITKLDWNDLRALAHKRGINPHGKKRVDLEAELGDLDDGEGTEKD